MSKVVVIVYAYKDKLLRNCIDSILKNSSGVNDISVNVIDKNNLDRSENFKDISYSHEMWDSVKNKFTSRNDIVKSTHGEYLLYVDGSKTFIEDWDIKLIDLLGNNEVLSGTNQVTFLNSDHKFFTTYSKDSVKEKTLTKWIDGSFIFTTFDIFKDFPILDSLRYRGESEVLSLHCFAKSLRIFAIPENYIVSTGRDILDYDYVPFSVNHNYNYVIDLFKGKENIFFKENVDIRSFENYMLYDFSKLSYHPFPENDIDYDPVTSIDDIDGTRFFGGIKSIYWYGII